MGNTTSKNIFSKFWYTNKSSSVTISSTKEINLETFRLVWLDPNVDTSNDNKMTQICLRKILTNLVTFDNVESCEEWLKKYNSNEKIIFIVSGAYGETLVPKIHYLPSIISIHIYCLDVERNKSWAKGYPKIQSVVSNTNHFLKQLSMNQTTLESIEDSKALQIYSLDIKTTSYIWYQLLLEILLSSDYLSTNSTFDKFVQIIREYSSNDEYGLNIISQFEQTYQSKQAISWLTRDTPLVRFVNKVLREQDINMLFVLRFLLVDIHNQLIKYQIDSLNAFRIQPMMKSEMENLSANPGQIVVINGFLFASTNMPQLISTITNNDKFESVLFKIKAKYRSGIAPFAFLRDIDLNIEEQIDREVLFMCGSIFVVGPLICENSIWTLELTLISDSEVSELYAMKKQLKQNHNLCIIGDLLNHCEQSDKAILYYEQLLNELPKQHTLIPQINKQLSIISKSNSNSQINTQYVLVNLSSHMTDFSSAMLGTLCSLTSDDIHIYNDESTIDFSKWSDQPTLLFTTAKFAETLNYLPECFTVFTLENDKIKDNCATIVDLMNQLADEIVRKYRLEAYEYTKTGELNKAQQQEEKANQICREIITIHKQFTTNIISKKTLNTIEPSLILLIPNNEDMDCIKEYFGDFFSSYYSFHNKHECHKYIVEQENNNDIFLIIHTDYQQLITNNFDQFSNVKYVYCYGKSNDAKEKIFETQNDLYYRLTYDLIGYYRELGDKYKTNNQSKLARDTFLKGQKLCQFLSEHFFLNK